MHFATSVCVKPGKKINLKNIKTDDDGGIEREEALDNFESLRNQLIELHDLLYAEKKHAVLIVLQAMDTGGKDSSIKNKLWKFSENDLSERKHWGAYQHAYADALSQCSTPYAPWYIIPAEKHWYRDLLIANILVDKLKSLKMHYPKVDFDPAKIVIK